MVLFIPDLTAPVFLNMKKIGGAPEAVNSPVRVVYNSGRKTSDEYRRTEGERQR
jgi:hypothetical protein